jgi:hypothetical protein
MIPTTKSVWALLGGVLLLIGPLTMQAGDVTLASDKPNIPEVREAGGKQGEGLPCNIPPGQNIAHAEQESKLASRLITGEVVQMDGNNFVVKEESGKEVRFQATQRTQKPPITQGDRISVSLDNESQALWIRANRGTSPRTEHASSDCNPNEEPSDKLIKQSKDK